MRILFVGVFDVNWSTNVSMLRVLERQGHIVVPFNYRTISAGFHAVSGFQKFDKLIDKAASFLRSDRIPINTEWYYCRNGRKEMNRELLKTVREGEFELVLLSKTDTVDYNLVSEINKYSPTWYYFMDPMDQAVRINANKYAVNSTWASATFSDVAKYFKKAGAKAYWITQGVDTDIFKPKKMTWVYDVVFVGTKTSGRSRYINALRNAGISVTCFGEGWENKPVYQEVLVDIYYKSRIVLNFCRPGAGFSIRVFQVMGTGAFLLTEYCADIEKFFKQGEQCDWFNNSNEMKEKILHYLSNEILIEKVGRDGCDFVHRNYSWEVMMKKIIDLVSS